MQQISNVISFLNAGHRKFKNIGYPGYAVFWIFLSNFIWFIIPVCLEIWLIMRTFAFIVSTDNSLVQ